MEKSYLKLLISAVAICFSCLFATAENSYEESHPVVRKNTVDPAPDRPEDMVIVGEDTLSMIIPQKNYGRFDRGLFNYLYIPKGQWAFGITASYGSLDTRDIQVLSVLDNFNFKGSIYSIKPSVSYFLGHNQSVGFRFNITNGKADLASLSMDVDDDMSFAINDVSYHTRSSQWGFFYRNYVGLNRSKLFAVFNEVSLDYGTGTSNFKRYYNDELFNTRTLSTMASLNFSPGVCVFLQDHVAFNLSFGVFGIRYNQEKQETNGVDEGKRISSGANFRFNIFNINFGLMVVI